MEVLTSMICEDRKGLTKFLKFAPLFHNILGLLRRDRSIGNATDGEKPTAMQFVYHFLNGQNPYYSDKVSALLRMLCLNLGIGTRDESRHPTAHQKYNKMFAELEGGLRGDVLDSVVADFDHKLIIAKDATRYQKGHHPPSKNAPSE